MKRAAVLLVFLLAAGFAYSQDIVGDWQGTLNPGMGELRLVLHITKAADGALKATIDSIDQPGPAQPPPTSPPMQKPALLT